MRAILRGRFVADSPRGVSVDAGIMVDDGIVVDVGDYDGLRRTNSSVVVREYDGILCPALINAHTHLELSALRREQFPHDDFVDWIVKLVGTRMSMADVDQSADCIKAKSEAESKGTAYFVNVGNDFTLNERLGENQLFAFEQLGINESSAGKVFERSSELVNGSASAALAIHAPYSVSPGLMRKIKSFNNSRGAVTSIHLSETNDEIEFVKSGRGRIMDLLNLRVGSWDFQPAGVSPVRYVDSLGILDGKTLCVHCVSVDDDDIEIMRKRGCAAAVCVRSNRELSDRVPPVGKFMKAGLRFLIGTDSRASSPDIDMFSETAAFYAEFNEFVPPEEVFRSATINAAEFLGIDGEYGSISPGKKAAIAYVPFAGSKNEVYEYLVADSKGKSTMAEI